MIWKYKKIKIKNKKNLNIFNNTFKTQNFNY